MSCCPLTQVVKILVEGHVEVFNKWNSGDGWKFSGCPGYAAANNDQTANTVSWVTAGLSYTLDIQFVPVDVSSNYPQIAGEASVLIQLNQTLNILPNRS